MKLSLPFDEAVALATSGTPLPPMVESLVCTGSTVEAHIDLRQVPSDSRAVRLALSAGGTVAVTAELVDYDAGTATFVVTAHARGLPAHRLLPYLVAPINAAVVRAGMPDGLVSVERGDEGDPRVLVDLQKAVDSRVEGLIVTAFKLEDEVIRLRAQVGEFRRLT